MLSYPIKISRKAGAVVGTFPDLPEVIIDSTDRRDALARASEILEAAIAVRMALRDDVPEPSAGRHRVMLPTQTAIKVRLYQVLRAHGISKSELARRLKWHSTQVDRLFDLKHASRLNQLEAAFRAVGLRLSVDVRDVSPQSQIGRSRSAQAVARLRKTKATQRGRGTSDLS